MASVNLSPDQDAYIHDDNPTTNYTTAEQLYAGENKNVANSFYRFLMRFNISSIPAGSTIDSATLSLYLRQAGSTFANNNRTLSAYRVKLNWVSAEATWNAYSSGNNWNSAGAFGANDVDTTSPVGTTALATTDADNSQHTMDWATIVQAWLDGTYSNYGALFRVATEDQDLYEIHSQNSSESSYRPVLAVTYTPPSSGGGSPMFFRGGFAMG